jgi:hypothetical protein
MSENLSPILPNRPVSLFLNSVYVPSIDCEIPLGIINGAHTIILALSSDIDLRDYNLSEDLDEKFFVQMLDEIREEVGILAEIEQSQAEEADICALKISRDETLEIDFIHSPRNYSSEELKNLKNVIIEETLKIIPLMEILSTCRKNLFDGYLEKNSLENSAIKN